MQMLLQLEIRKQMDKMQFLCGRSPTKQCEFIDTASMTKIECDVCIYTRSSIPEYCYNECGKMNSELCNTCPMLNPELCKK
jgi:hypothetical protein